MKRIIQRVCAMGLALIFLAVSAGNALAASIASYYLTKYTADVSTGNSGVIEIKFSVGANRPVSELGASYIVLEESGDRGKTWHVAEEYEDEDWMTTTGRMTYTGVVTYPGTIGYQYRVTAEVFARDENGGDSRTTPTSPAVTATR